MASEDSAIHASDRSGSIPAAIRWSETLGKFAETIGKWGTLFMIPLVLITVWDVFQRKILKFIGDVMLAQGWTDARDTMYDTLFTLLPFRSTLLQELEWHFHTAMFVLVLGYGYIYNRHVRVDLIREKLEFRKQAWIELFGVSFLMLPYCVIVGYFAVDYAMDSYAYNEQSASLVGLQHRWAIKVVLVIGLLLAFMAGLAVWLQVVVALFGSRDNNFALYTIERQHEKVEKRMLLENIDDSFSDGSNEAKRGDSSKLLSRQIDPDAFAHAADTRGQKFFYYFGMAVVVLVLILLFHTFDFWSWLI